MIQKAENIILKKRLRKRSEKLKRQNERIRRRETENRNIKNNMRRTAQELEDIKGSLTTGFCRTVRHTTCFPGIRSGGWFPIAPVAELE